MRLFRRGQKQPPSREGLDQLTIAQLEKAGADLHVPRVTDHFLYFSREPEARAAAASLARPSRTVTTRQTGGWGSEWLVEIQQTIVVDIEQITALRREFEAATTPSGGRYDGWGATASND